MGPHNPAPEPLDRPAFAGASCSSYGGPRNLIALSPKSVPSNPWGLCDHLRRSKAVLPVDRPGCPVRRQGFGLGMSCRKDPLPVPGIARDTRKLRRAAEPVKGGRRDLFALSTRTYGDKKKQGPRYLESHSTAHFPEHSFVLPYGILGPASPTRPENPGNHNPVDAVPSRPNPRRCRPKPSKTRDQRGFALPSSRPLRCRRFTGLRATGTSYPAL